jgi:hypothetical protein
VSKLLHRLSRETPRAPISPPQRLLRPAPQRLPLHPLRPRYRRHTVRRRAVHGGRDAEPRPLHPDAVRQPAQPPRQLVVGQLLRPYPAGAMMATAVNPWVNDARHEAPQCIEPAADQPELFPGE